MTSENRHPAHTDVTALSQAELDGVSGGWGIAPGLFAQKATPQQGKGGATPQETVSLQFGGITNDYSPQ